MRDNRFNGTGGGMNRRIGCTHFISKLSSYFTFKVAFLLIFGLIVLEVNCLCLN